MSAIPPAIDDLARRLIALEAARNPAGAAGRVCEGLRASLVQLVGVAGFGVLMARALALATADVPALASVRVRPDGSLEGLDAAVNPPGIDEGAVVVARLLGLLVEFVGVSLTLRLAREAWPDAPTNGSDRGGEAQP